jgi:putative iron-dependent peroxidase
MSMLPAQPGILAPVPRAARYLTLTLKEGAQPGAALRALAKGADGKACVVGLGEPLLRVLDGTIAGMRPFPSYAGAKVETPSTPAALWCWLRGEERGEIVLRSLELQRALAQSFQASGVIDAFRHGRGLDLTGFEDGTENPKGAKAVAAAVSDDASPGLRGSSFVAVQQWVHDFAAFAAMTGRQQDNAIGRRRRDNKELDSAPPSSHVKRTAQETFAPEAFVLRRSMPWADATGAGLNFVAFGKSLDAFEAQLRRMTGAEDGTVDALYTFTRPVTGAYFWCPPVKRKGLDLRAIGL